MVSRAIPSPRDRSVRFLPHPNDLTTLSPTERLLVEAHPVIGDRILEALAGEYGSALGST